MESGKSVAIAAEYYGNVAGYVNVYFSGNDADTMSECFLKNFKPN